MSTIADITFFVDIFVAFRTTFVDPISGEEETNTKLMAREYLWGHFSIDLLAVIPFESITAVRNLTLNRVLDIFENWRLKKIQDFRAGQDYENIETK